MSRLRDALLLGPAVTVASARVQILTQLTACIHASRERQWNPFTNRATLEGQTAGSFFMSKFG